LTHVPLPQRTATVDRHLVLAATNTNESQDEALGSLMTCSTMIVRGAPSLGLLELESLTFNIDIFNLLSTP
jgi:hypothetical protein